MQTIRIPVQKDWDVYGDRESLYVELNFEDISVFIGDIVEQKLKELKEKE